MRTDPDGTVWLTWAEWWRRELDRIFRETPKTYPPKPTTPKRTDRTRYYAGKDRSVLCPKCGAKSSYNGRPWRICAKGHSFTERNIIREASQ